MPRFFSTIVCLGIAMLLLGTSGLTADEPTWKVGVAVRKITPEEPLWMAGYASRKEPSDGVLQDLFAKGLAFEDAEGQRAVMVTLDLIGVPRTLYDTLAARVEQKYDLPRESVLWNASHTHCGPVVSAGRHSFYELADERRQKIDAYNVWLTDVLVELVGAALADLEPARLEYSFARAGVAMNRRLPVDGDVRNSPYPPGPVDHAVPVLRGIDADDKTKVILFGYACHNTTLGIQKFCGDYAGYAQQEIEQDVPGSVAMFMMGCGGDQNPYPRRQVIWAERHGRALANAVAAALDAQPMALTGTLRTAMEFVDLEFATPPTREELERDLQRNTGYQLGHTKRLLARLDEEGSLPTHYSYPVQVWRLGSDLTLVTLAGETVVDFSLRIKQELPGQVWVAGYTNDVFGYVPSRRVLEEGGYEGGGAMTYTSLPGPFAPDVEERIIDAVQRLAESTK